MIIGLWLPGSALQFKSAIAAWEFTKNKYIQDYGHSRRIIQRGTSASSRAANLMSAVPRMIPVPFSF